MTASKHDTVIRKLNIGIIAVSAAMLFITSAAFFASGASKKSSGVLVDAHDDDSIISLSVLNVKQMWPHLEALQSIADSSGGNRGLGSEGFFKSVDYFQEELSKYPDYFKVELQHFSALLFEVVDATFVVPLIGNLWFQTDFTVFGFSGSGNVNAATATQVRAQGCFDSDFGSFSAGDVAVIVAGNCTFRNKALRAQRYGAKAVVFVNTVNVAWMYAATVESLQPLVTIPVVGLRAGLLPAVSNQQIQIQVKTNMPVVNATNLLATTIGGDPNSLVICAAHMDSVQQGPGINDDGSGCSINLALAKSMAEGKKFAKNQVMFAWWGGEEPSRIGSRSFVDIFRRSHNGDLSSIAANYNLDLVGSPNFERAIYDAANVNPLVFPKLANGTVALANLIAEKHQQLGMPFTWRDFNGLSDYGSFSEQFVTAGGITTGEDTVKSMQGRDDFGGIANVVLDGCHHKACDTIKNVNKEALLGSAQITAAVIEDLANRKDLKQWLQSQP